MNPPKFAAVAILLCLLAGTASAQDHPNTPSTAGEAAKPLEPEGSGAAELVRLRASVDTLAAGFFLGTGLTLTSGILLAVAADDRYRRYQQSRPLFQRPALRARPSG